MTISVSRLLSSLPVTRAEVTEPLLTGNGFRFERIVSHGQASPDGFWYDQTGVERRDGRAGIDEGGIPHCASYSLAGNVQGRRSGAECRFHQDHQQIAM